MSARWKSTKTFKCNRKVERRLSCCWHVFCVLAQKSKHSGGITVSPDGKHRGHQSGLRSSILTALRNGTLPPSCFGHTQALVATGMLASQDWESVLPILVLLLAWESAPFYQIDLSLHWVMTRILLKTVSHRLMPRNWLGMHWARLAGRLVVWCLVLSSHQSLSQWLAFSSNIREKMKRAFQHSSSMRLGASRSWRVNPLPVNSQRYSNTTGKLSSHVSCEP